MKRDKNLVEKRTVFARRKVRKQNRRRNLILLKLNQKETNWEMARWKKT